MPFKLSPSSLNLMQECERCFWLDKHNKWKRPSGNFPSLPSGMDRILKTHFDNFMRQGLLPPELKGNGETKGLLLFDDEEMLKIWWSQFKGIQWEDKDGNILRGAVDNVLRKGSKLIILDYKTRGFALKEDTHEHYQNQIDLYNLLLRKNKHDTEDYAFLLFYHPKEVKETGEVIFNTDLKKMKVNIKNAEKIWNKAIKLLNRDCPSKCCEWCDGRWVYRKNGWKSIHFIIR